MGQSELPQFPNGIVSSVSLVSTTNTASSFAGFVALALAADAVAVAGHLRKILSRLIDRHRAVVDLTLDLPPQARSRR
jgi:hypothetical protein